MTPDITALRWSITAILVAICFDLMAVSSAGGEEDAREQLIGELTAAGGDNISVELVENAQYEVVVRKANSAHISILRKYSIGYLALIDPLMPDLVALKGLSLPELSVSGGALTSLNGFNSPACHSFHLDSTGVDDLSPLQTCKSLKRVDLIDCPVTNIGVLSAHPLERLNIRGSKVKDLGPVRGMPLKRLSISGTGVKDISALAGMRLAELDISYTAISDISILKGMPLKELIMHETAVKDLSVLKGMPLEVLYFDADAVTNGFGLIRRIESLGLIGTEMSSHRNDGCSPLKFWLKYDEKKALELTDTPNGIKKP